MTISDKQSQVIHDSLYKYHCPHKVYQIKSSNYLIKSFYAANRGDLEFFIDNKEKMEKLPKNIMENIAYNYFLCLI